MSMHDLLKKIALIENSESQSIRPQQKLDEQQGVAEGKRADRYHIVGKDGKPVNLASYADEASAIKDRDAKYPGAVVQRVGPRGKVKGVAEDKGSKPDFLDLDKDGDRKESMKKAAADKEKIPVKESWTDFEDSKKAHEKAGSTVTGRPDDYTVTMMDGTRKRFITKDGKRRVETLPPVQKRSDDEDEDTAKKATKKKETTAAEPATGKRRGRPPGSKNKKISEMTDHEFHGMITYYKLMESELSDEQKAKKEEIAKSMKDSPEKVADLKKRYGKRWKNVVFATATKKAKETVNEMIGDGYFIIFTGKDWDRAAQGPYRSKEDAERANPAPPNKSKIVNQHEFAKWKEAQVRAQPTPGKKKVDEAAGALARLGPRGVSLFRGPQRQPEKFMGNVEVVNPRRAPISSPTGTPGITPRQAAAATAGVAATGAGLGYLASRDKASAEQMPTNADGGIDYSLAATNMQGTPMSPNALPGGLPAALDQIDKTQQAAAAKQNQRALLPSDDARSPDGSSGLPPSSNKLPSAASSAAPASSSIYQVTRGDTLSQIAQRNNTSVRELIRLNPEITNPDVIRAGQKINIAGAPQSTYAGGVGTAADTQAKIASGTYTPSPISDKAAERAGIGSTTVTPAASPELQRRSEPTVNATQTGLAAAASNKFMDPYGGSASNTFDTSKIDTSITPPAEAGKGLDSATDLPDNADKTDKEKIEYTESINNIRKLAGLK